jgi:hypothetical protein
MDLATVSQSCDNITDKFKLFILNDSTMQSKKNVTSIAQGEESNVTASL